MCFYIGIEDLAANAIIELLKQNKRFVSYSDIDRYGAKVLKFMQGNGKKAVLVLSRESTNAFFRNYSDFFEESIENNKAGIKLKEGKTNNDLIQQFRGYLAIDVLLALINKESISVFNTV